MTTELLLPGYQNGKFHETYVTGPEVRWLMDEWHNALTQLPLAVAHDLGIPPPTAHRNAFKVPGDYVQTAIDDPRALLAPVYVRLAGESGLGYQKTAGRAAAMFEMAWQKDISHMRHWWKEGYFPRTDSIVWQGNHYQIYNHQPAFTFTGEVKQYEFRNLRTGGLEQWLAAEFDTEPLIGEDGDFVPNDPDVPVLVLPAMSFEHVVDRNLVNAHLDALRSSLAPWVVERYAQNLRGQPSAFKRALAHLAVMVS